MCTLVFLYKVVKDAPIVAMHNRYERAGTLEYPPRKTASSQKIYAPVDVRSNGTWVGFNDSGVFAAVSDQHSGIDTQFRRSRGLLIQDVLGMFKNSKDAVKYLEKELLNGYKRGNFIIADRQNAFRILFEDGHIKKSELKPGIHVMTSFTRRENTKYGSVFADIIHASEEREKRAIDLASKLSLKDANSAIEGLKVLSADHKSEHGHPAICFHGKNDWTMTSSTIISISKNKTESRILYCEGNSCTGHFNDYSNLMAEHAPGGEIELKNNRMNDVKVAFCMSGSVACIGAPKIARELRRNGCTIDCFMTHGAIEFGLSPKLMEWATGRKVFVELSGLAEHLSDYDVVLVYPATFNTIRKIVLGIADNAVTTLCASNPGDKLVIVPAMNMKLYQNHLLKEGLDELRKRGATVIAPRIEEGIAKIPRRDEVIENVFRKIAVGRLNGKGVLVLSGPTRYNLDAVRYISNYSSGGLGASIAREAFKAGSNVTVITGPAIVKPPRHLRSINVATVEEMLESTVSELSSNKYDIVMFPAAILDFKPSAYVSSKVKSDAEWKITLKPTPKTIEKISKMFPKILIVGFKLEAGLPDTKLISAGTKRMKEIGAALMVVNDLNKINGKKHPAYIISKSGKARFIDGTKEELAFQIISELGSIQ
jgi:phosphopantothenoylcysteine decarboxylase/phosphopantothenate--cysteine ligase